MVIEWTSCHWSEAFAQRGQAYWTGLHCVRIMGKSIPGSHADCGYAGAGRDSCEIWQIVKASRTTISRCLYLYIYTQQRFLRPAASLFHLAYSTELAHTD